MPITADKLKMWAAQRDDKSAADMAEIASGSNRATLVGSASLAANVFGTTGMARAVTGSNGFNIDSRAMLPGSGGWMLMPLTSTGTSPPGSWLGGNSRCRLQSTSTGFIRFQGTGASTSARQTDINPADWSYNDTGDPRSVIVAVHLDLPGSSGSATVYVIDASNDDTLATATTSWGTDTLSTTAGDASIGYLAAEGNAPPMNVDGMILIEDRTVTIAEVKAAIARCRAAGVWMPGWMLTDAVASINDYTDHTEALAYYHCVECGRTLPTPATEVSDQDFVVAFWTQAEGCKLFDGPTSQFQRMARLLHEVLRAGDRIEPDIVIRPEDRDTKDGNAHTPEGGDFTACDPSDIGVKYSQNVSFSTGSLTVTLGPCEPGSLLIETTAPLSDGKIGRWVANPDTGAIVAVGTSLEGTASTEAAVSSGAFDATTGEVSLTLSGGQPSVATTRVTARAPNGADPESLVDQLTNAFEWLQVFARQKGGRRPLQSLRFLFNGVFGVEARGDSVSKDDFRRTIGKRGGFGPLGRAYADLVTTNSVLDGQGWYQDTAALATMAGHMTTFATALKAWRDANYPGMLIYYEGDEEFNSLVTQEGRSVTPAIFADVLADARASTQKVDGIWTWQQIATRLPGWAYDYIVTGNDTTTGRQVWAECLRPVYKCRLLYLVDTVIAGPLSTVFGSDATVSEYDTTGGFYLQGRFWNRFIESLGRTERDRLPVIKTTRLQFSPEMYAFSPVDGGDGFGDYADIAGDLGLPESGSDAQKAMSFRVAQAKDELRAASLGGDPFTGWLTRDSLASGGGYLAVGVPSEIQFHNILDFGRRRGMRAVNIYINLSSSDTEEADARKWLPVLQMLGLLGPQGRIRIKTRNQW